MSVKAQSFVWEHSQQRGSHLLVLIAIADQANDEGDCYLGIERLADKARIGVRYTQMIINKLILSGELQVWDGMGIRTTRGYTNLYRIIMPGVNQDSPLKSPAIFDLYGVNHISPVEVNPRSPLRVNPISPKPSGEPSGEPSDRARHRRGGAFTAIEMDEDDEWIVPDNGPCPEDDEDEYGVGCPQNLPGYRPVPPPSSPKPKPVRELDLGQAETFAQVLENTSSAETITPPVAALVDAVPVVDTTADALRALLDDGVDEDMPVLKIKPAMDTAPLVAASETNLTPEPKKTVGRGRSVKTPLAAAPDKPEKPKRAKKAKVEPEHDDETKARIFAMRDIVVREWHFGTDAYRKAWELSEVLLAVSRRFERYNLVTPATIADVEKFVGWYRDKYGQDCSLPLSVDSLQTNFGLFRGETAPKTPRTDIPADETPEQRALRLQIGEETFYEQLYITTDFDKYIEIQFSKARRAYQAGDTTEMERLLVAVYILMDQLHRVDYHQTFAEFEINIRELTRDKIPSGGNISPWAWERTTRSYMRQRGIMIEE